MAIKIANNIFSLLSFGKKPVAEMPMNIGSPLDIVITKGPDAAEAPEFLRDPLKFSNTAGRTIQDQDQRNPLEGLKRENRSNRYSFRPPALLYGTKPSESTLQNGNTSKGEILSKKGTARAINTSSRIRKGGKRGKQQRISISQRVRKSSIGRAAAAALAKLNLSAATAAGAVKAPFLSPRTLKDSNKQFARLGLHLRTGSFENYRIKETTARTPLSGDSNSNSPRDPLLSPELPPVPLIPRFVVGPQDQTKTTQNIERINKTVKNHHVPQELEGEANIAGEDNDFFQETSSKQLSSRGRGSSMNELCNLEPALSVAHEEANPFEETPQLNYSLKPFITEKNETQKPSPVLSKYVPESGSLTDLRARRQLYQVRKQADALATPRTSTNLVVFPDNDYLEPLKDGNSARSPYDSYDIDAILAAYL